MRLVSESSANVRRVYRSIRERHLRSSATPTPSSSLRLDIRSKCIRTQLCCWVQDMPKSEPAAFRPLLAQRQPGLALEDYGREASGRVRQVARGIDLPIEEFYLIFSPYGGGLGISFRISRASCAISQSHPEVQATALSLLHGRVPAALAAALVNSSLVILFSVMLSPVSR